jgi:glycosyltransferase involved in cell wall biosynthesis
MRFAFVSAMIASPWGGSEELWSQTAVQLKRAGHDVQASIAHWPRLSDKVAALAQYGIKLDAYPCASNIEGRVRRFWNRLSLGTRRSHGRLKRFNPDLVVISQGANSGGFAWTKVCRDAAIPYVIIAHCNSESWWIVDRDVSEAVASYTTARKVFCVSHHNLDLLRLQLGEPLPNAEVVWNPYNASTGHAPPWPEEGEVWRLACVARMHVAAKGQDLLFQILARPEWRDRPVELNLFGTGPDELGLRRLCGMLQMKNVHFRGHVSDIRTIWEQNHLLVLPSRYEGLPLSLVEAMWCGRPAVVTDVGGNAEVCVDNETGFVAPAPTVSLLADTLERAWDRRKDWQRMGQAARARAESQIPRDPISVFSERLRSYAGPARQALTSAKPN